MTLASHADNNAQHELIIYKPATSLPRTIAPSPHPFSIIDPVTVALFVADQPHLNYSVTSTSTRANTRHAAATPHQAEVNTTLDIAHVLPSRLSCSSLSASLTLPPHHHQCAPPTEVQTSIPSMKRRYSDTDLAPFAIAALATTSTDNMGRTYRTPSPAPQDYISSSKLTARNELIYHELTRR
jgi:hypothetical protein